MKLSIALAAALVLSSCSGVLSHDVPSGQPALADLQFTSFQQSFNAAPGAKLLVMMSPT